MGALSEEELILHIPLWVIESVLEGGESKNFRSEWCVLTKSPYQPTFQVYGFWRAEDCLEFVLNHERICHQEDSWRIKYILHNGLPIEKEDLQCTKS